MGKLVVVVEEQERRERGREIGDHDGKSRDDESQGNKI